MDPSLLKTYFQYENDLVSNCNNSLPDGFLSFLKSLMYQSEVQNIYSKPIMWIGIYIAIASLFCILPMLADLLHGFKTQKLWFPCKYFTLNAASLTIRSPVMGRFSPT
ncbi:hypothetical protein HanIR_Chr08g0363711 [Helianthus annuus]|nr:hypothetical protein HanIR_Chr08g0363711 [Helianthus annuus]KAJ0719017.1 hypothetical protein HanLR1_Chr08g0277061 [Helianthus annuus]